MTQTTITVPELGGASEVEVIEVCVAVGDAVEAEQSLVVVESDKASMDVPCPQAGRIVSIAVSEGDSVSEGQALVELEIEGADTSAGAPDSSAEAATTASEEQTEVHASEPPAPEPQAEAGRADVETGPQSQHWL